MKMAEPPSEAIAEEPPTPNQEDSVITVMEKPAEDTGTAVVENGQNEPTENLGEAEVNPAAETDENTVTDVDRNEGDNGNSDLETSTETGVKQTATNEDSASKPGTREETSNNAVEKKENAEDLTQNGANAPEKVEELVKSDRDDSLPQDTEEHNVLDDQSKKETAVVEGVVEASIAPTESEVNVEGNNEHVKSSESVDQNEKLITDNAGEDTVEEDISRLTKKQLKERYENLQTKYTASELQLDALREQNAEFIAKMTTLEEELQKAGSKSSSAVDMREKARQRDGLRVQADYLARELSQVQDTEKYLREKVAELLEEKEESERRVKDLQLRLKRFVKDDQAKDERVAKLETEIREISQEVQQLEAYVDDETLQKVRRSRSNTERSGQNGEAGGAARSASPAPQSKTCVIL